MSAQWSATADQQPRVSRPTGLDPSSSGPTARRPRLRAVPAAGPRLARVPFVSVLIGLFGLGMAGLLMLNTLLQDQAFEARSLDRQAGELAYVQNDRQSRLDQVSAPQELTRRASALKLRPNPRPAFLVVPTGKVIGEAEPITGGEVPSLVVKTPAEIAAERAAAAAKKKAAEAAKKRAAAKAAAEAAAKAAEDAARQQPAQQSQPKLRQPRADQEAE